MYLVISVSYTHLDVYKRQIVHFAIVVALSLFHWTSLIKILKHFIKKFGYVDRCLQFDARTGYRLIRDFWRTELASVLLRRQYNNEFKSGFCFLTKSRFNPSDWWKGWWHSIERGYPLYQIIKNAWVSGVEIKKVMPNILSKLMQIHSNWYKTLTLLLIADLALPWYGDHLAHYLESSHEILSFTINRYSFLNLQLTQFFTEFKYYLT